MKLFCVPLLFLALTSAGQINNFPLYSSGAYGGTQSGDYTGISNAQLKLNATTGYVRVLHISADPGVSAVYNFQTGKNAYWGETGDVGAYYFRGRNLYINEGTVGIGTNSPNAKLEIASSGTGGGTLIYGGVIGSRNSGHELNLVGGTPIDGAWTSQMGGHIRLGGSTRGDINKNAIQFIQNGVEIMRVHDGGNVGIGTTAPDSKLTVKGTIHSQEVKVDLNGSVAPDYVFDKDYPLTSLEELKSYIEQNKHLPEIPSANEMVEEGMNLKEMNLLLLKKLEELTLHIIKQDERISELEKSKDKDR